MVSSVVLLCKPEISSSEECHTKLARVFRTAPMVLEGTSADKPDKVKSA